MGQSHGKQSLKYTPGNTTATVSAIPYDVEEEIKHKSDWSSIKTKLIYQPIQYSHRRCIRVVQLLPSHHNEIAGHDMPHCRLRTADLDSEDSSYTSVSYVWGDPAKTEDIIVEQEGDNAPSFFKVNKNLYAILKAYAPGLRPITCTFWIDAICINQADDMEKSHQVRLMTDIYSRASSVWAWLGSEETRLFQFYFFNVLQVWEKRTKSAVWPPPSSVGLAQSPPPPPPEHELYKFRKAIRAVIKVLERPSGNFITGFRHIMGVFSHHYFQRIWTQQEVLCNDDVYFRFYADLDSEPISVPLQKFREFLMIFRYIIYAIDADAKQKLMSSEEGALVKTILNSLLFSTRLPLMLADKQDCSLLDILARLRTSQPPYDDRDNVFGVLGFAADAEKLDITIDYSISTVDVFTETAKVILVKGQDLSVLSYCSPSSSGLTLPSWAPDWSLKEQFPVPRVLDAISAAVNEGSNMPNASASGGSKPRLKVTDAVTPLLEIDGYRVAQVRAVGQDQIQLPDGQTNNNNNNNNDDDEDKDFLASNLSHVLHHMSQLTNLAAYNWLDASNDEGWRTLTGTLTPLGPNSAATRLKSSFASLLTIFQSMTQNDAANAENNNSATTTAVRFTLRDANYAICVSRIIEFMTGRTCFVTETGLVGVGPAHTRAGDVVCVFLGGGVPFVLRRLDGGEVGQREEDEGEMSKQKGKRDEYRLVGECFVYRIMFGEAVRSEAEVERFCIK